MCWVNDEGLGSSVCCAAFATYLLCSLFYIVHSHTVFLWCWHMFRLLWWVCIGACIALFVVAVVLCSVANLICYWNQFENSCVVCVFFCLLPLFLFCLTLFYCCVMNLAPPIQSYISCQQYVWNSSVRTIDRILFTLHRCGETHRCDVALNAAAVRLAFRIFENDACVRGERQWARQFVQWVVSVGGADGKINTI